MISSGVCISRRTGFASGAESAVRRIVTTTLINTGGKATSNVRIIALQWAVMIDAGCQPGQIRDQKRRLCSCRQSVDSLSYRRIRHAVNC
ncbi:MAG: hypothetical protein ACLTXL_05940 [Clostridia bacterium]